MDEFASGVSVSAREEVGGDFLSKSVRHGGDS